MQDSANVHIVLGFVFAIAMVALTALETIFIPNFNATETFFVVIQNVGLGVANSYYISNVSFTPTGLTETTKA